MTDLEELLQRAREAVRRSKAGKVRNPLSAEDLKMLREIHIGVHPKDWSDRPAWIQDCDEGIRLAVTILDAGGVETFQSCEGGAGHSFPEPIVEFHGSIEEGYRAAAWALTYGLPVHELRRVYSYYDGELHGPTWALTFRRTSSPSSEQGAAREETT